MNNREMTEPEILLSKLKGYLLHFPKHNTHGSAISCEDIQILTANYSVTPRNDGMPNSTFELQYVSSFNPLELVRAHTEKIKGIITAKQQDGYACIVRTYPEITGNVNGLRIYTRLQFGKAEDIILKLLPPRPDEIL